MILGCQWGRGILTTLGGKLDEISLFLFFYKKTYITKLICTFHYMFNNIFQRKFICYKEWIATMGKFCRPCSFTFFYSNRTTFSHYSSKFYRKTT